MPENSWYQWYDWLINYIPESMKKFKSNGKEKIMRPFESKRNNWNPTDYKPKQIVDDFKKVDMFNAKARRINTHQS